MKIPNRYILLIGLNRIAGISRVTMQFSLRGSLAAVHKISGLPFVLNPQVPQDHR